jgi:hypothetical protein
VFNQDRLSGKGELKVKLILCRSRATVKHREIPENRSLSKTEELSMENQNLIAIMAHAVEREYRQTDGSAYNLDESNPAHTPTQDGFSWRKVWRKFANEKGAASMADPKQSLR